MATELGQAYVQIIPSAKGISGKITEALNPEASKAGSESGSSLGSSLVSVAKKVIAAAGIGEFIKETLNAGADLQQSIGGIETLFGDSADKVKAYAAEAFNTAGLSANDYMENVSGFAAALNQSVEDSNEAADVANQTMIDMADNANKMGTPMEDIQHAYQGFAKQNYTMLDNLKLGYGGTKSEMERLLADAEKISGVHYDINQLDDVYNAIHVIQGDLGITGTTAKEAATTFSGSFASMKAAATDLMGNLALGEDITPQLENLISTAKTFLIDNLVPMLINIGTSAAKALGDAIVKGLDSLGIDTSGITDGLSDAIENLKKFKDNFLAAFENSGALDAMKSAFESFSGLVSKAWETIIKPAVDAFIEALPQLGTVFGTVFGTIATVLSTVFSVVNDIRTTVVEAIGTLVDSAMPYLQKGFEEIQTATGPLADAIKNLWDNILVPFGEFMKRLAEEFLPPLAAFLGNVLGVAFQALAKVISVVFTAISAAINWFVSIFENSGITIEGTIEAIKGFFSGMRDTVSTIINTISTTITTVFTAIKTTIETIWNAIVTTITTVVNTISSTVSTVFNTVRGVVTDIWNGIKTAIETPINAARDIVSTVLDTIKGFFTSLTSGSFPFPSLDTGFITAAKDTISQVLDTIKGFFTGLSSGSFPFPSLDTGFISTAKDTIDGVLEKIKGAFNFSWSLPHLDLPHLSVSGGVAPFGIGGKGSLPSFSIQWYANAMEKGVVLDEPTIFGMMDGKLLGAGDAGPEAVIGVNSLQEMINRAVLKQDRAIIGAIVNNAPTERRGGFIQNLTINSPKELSPSETARQTRLATRNLVLSMMRA